MKHCVDCHQDKSYSEFVPKSSCKDGYEVRCRTCRSIKYNRSTPDLLLKKIYASQATNSINRGHPLPKYSFDELIDWANAQPTFPDLWDAYVASNYSTALVPSIDRLDDSLPYTLDNIQVITWTINRLNGAKAKSQGVGSGMPLRAVAAYNADGTLHKTFISIMEAVRYVEGRMWGVVSVANGKPITQPNGRTYQPKSYKGFIWKWL